MMPMQVSAYGQTSSIYDPYVISWEEKRIKFQFENILDWIFYQ